MYKGDALIYVLCGIGFVYAALTVWHGWMRHTASTIAYCAATIAIVVFTFLTMNNDPHIGDYKVKPSIYPECAMYTTVEQKSNCEAVVEQQHQNDINPAPPTTIYFS